jgi:hypothetical protein
MGGACGTYGGEEWWGFGGGKTEGKRPLGIRCRALEYNIKEFGLKHMSFLEQFSQIFSLIYTKCPLLLYFNKI